MTRHIDSRCWRREPIASGGSGGSGGSKHSGTLALAIQPRKNNHTQGDQHRGLQVQAMGNADHLLASSRSNAVPVGQNLNDQHEQGKRGDTRFEAVEAHRCKSTQQGDNSPDEATEQ